MHKKITATRQAAFLKAVAQTGNQTLAAERAKVSRSWVTLHRSRDAGFDAAVREACAAFARQERSCTKPPAGWGHLDGVELVVRGTGGSPGRRGAKRVQIARARLHQWDAGVEERFLATLLATCNATAACAAVGMTPTSAYAHARRWPAFAAKWDAAVEEGYARIEAALLVAGENLFSARELPAELPITGMTVQHAIHILHMHKHQARGLGRAPGKRWRPPPSLDDPGMRESLQRIQDRFERTRHLSEEVKARDREVHARRRRGSAGEGRGGERRVASLDDSA